MGTFDWIKEFPAAVMVCDTAGIILDMNDRAALAYQPDGGRQLIGKSMLDCHPEAARTKAEALLTTRRTNTYTIEKNGIKKLIHQSPWYRDGQYAGFVELSIEIPLELPHFVRS